MSVSSLKAPLSTPCWHCRHFGGSPRQPTTRLIAFCLRPGDPSGPYRHDDMAAGCARWEASERLPMRLLVCGSLTCTDRHAVFHALDLVLTRRRVDTLIHGAAAGVDTVADQWAVAREIQRQVFPVSPEQWARVGLAASPLRNTRMLLEGRPDGVVAFPGGPGTEDMVLQARVAGIPVWRPYE
ncbi:MAG: DUF2493 domain-containing protein [Aquabacterium sp.]